ncbi:MAG: PIN domain-containing protein [Betaproteobacteria bacterium]|nr:PIN domain-containing protein [Betaproteobacteria bacterium]
MAFVADNSVVVGWFIASQPDTYAETLLARAEKEDVCVPFIWRAEFASVLLAFVHNRKLQQARVASVIEHIERLEMIVDSSPPSVRTLVDLGRRYALGAYDAAYLELALRGRLPLASRDGPLRKAASRAGVLLT